MLLKFYHDSLQYFLFQSRVYIFGQEDGESFIFRDRFYRDCQSKSCDILNVIAAMLSAG